MSSIALLRTASVQATSISYNTAVMVPACSPSGDRLAFGCLGCMLRFFQPGTQQQRLGNEMIATEEAGRDLGTTMVPLVKSGGYGQSCG